MIYYANVGLCRLQFPAIELELIENTRVAITFEQYTYLQDYNNGIDLTLEIAQ